MPDLWSLPGQRFPIALSTVRSDPNARVAAATLAWRRRSPSMLGDATRGFRPDRSDQTVRVCARRMPASMPAHWDAGDGSTRRRHLHSSWTDRGGGRRGATELLLHGKRLAHSDLRFWLGGLGPGLGGRAAAGREVDACLQL